MESAAAVPQNVPYNEQLAQQAFAEAVRPDPMQERRYEGIKNDPQRLADRFMALLPPLLREKTACRVDANARALIVTGPAQVVATADQLIPRMDSNLQLSEGLIDYGTAAAPDAPQTEPAVAVSGEKPSEPYYDPNENRMVRTLNEPEHAILPTSDSERGMAVLGENQQAAPSAAEAGQTPDVAVYACSPKTIAVAVARLKTTFASNPEVVITSDPQGGKIIVYATGDRQKEVRTFLASLNVYPRENDAMPFGESAQASGATLPAAEPPIQGVQAEFVPVYKNLSTLETEWTGLLQSRLERVFPLDPNDPNLSAADREKSIWRFTRRNRAGIAQAESEAARCDVFFNPSEQKITMMGEERLVAQMKTLLESLDRSGRTGANRPHYIMLKNADPNQIQEIFEVQRRATRQASEATGIEGSSNDAGKMRTLSSDAQVRGQDSGCVFGGSENASIRPVNWQEGGLDLGDAGSLGDAAGLGDAGGFDPSAPRVPGQIDLVPDFVPLVLPDLDMVILDAPEAEAKRIIEMIDRIEKLAAEADPKTEIYYLKHVNSVMLGGVLSKLYTEMFATKQGRVMVYPMQYPNAILLVGWGEAPKAMKALIETFDQPIQSKGSTIQVVALKYASAREVATLLTQYFPVPESVGGGFSPRIRVLPDPRTNSLIIQAAPNDFEEIQKVLMDLDVNKSESKLQVRTFALKHSLAEDIRTSIAQAILPAMQGTLPASEAKYPILEIMTVDADSKKLIESGIMRDVQISADIQNNKLIVTAPADCMELLATLIDMLDVAPAKAQIKIFPLRYADATQVQKTLQPLLPTGGGSLPSIPNAEGEESFVPVRFSIDTRTNCILATASPRDLKMLDSLIIALDRKDTSERRQEVITLRNVKAASITEAVNKYLAEKQRLELSSGTISDYQLFDSQVIVVPEGDTNSVIISATPKYLEEITTLVKSFDNEPAQVVIQVLIAEVILSDDEEFGIEAGLQDSIAFDRSLVTSVTNGTNSATGVPGFDIIGNNEQGNNYLSTADPSDLAGTAVSALGMGRTSSDLGYGGLVLSASSQSVQVLLRALREKNRLQILSRPQIQAMDNQQAFILIGQRVPRISGATTSSYSVTSNVTEANVGLILLVTPRISQDGRVIMEIGAEKSSLGSDSDAIPVYTSGNQVIKSPTIDTTQVMTAVSAVNGETVMLGGLITNTKSKISRGVPYISDIPVVGWLFRYDKASEERRELIIVMTPRVVQDRSDSEKVKRIEASKMSWCLQDAMGINGSMGLYNPLGPSKSVSPKVRNLPFLEMDSMEEIPASAVHPYAPENDYPETSFGAYPAANAPMAAEPNK